MKLKLKKLSKAENKKTGFWWRLDLVIGKKVVKSFRGVARYDCLDEMCRDILASKSRGVYIDWIYDKSGGD